MKSILLLLSALGCAWLAGLPTLATAQEQVTIPRAEYETLKQQAESAKQLQVELDRVRVELTRLKQGSQGSQPTAAAPPASRATSGEKPAAVEAGHEPSKSETSQPRREPTPLPALEPGAIMDVTDIIQHFAQNPASAAQRYDGKKVRLQGVIAAFDKPLLRRDFEIVFRTAAGQLVCRVAPPERFTAVFTTRAGAALTGRTERGGESELLKVGDVVSLEGTGQGLKDGSILFTRCQVAGLK